MSAGYAFGMTAHGILVHSPGRDGHLVIAGRDTGNLTQQMLLHWEDDAEIAILSPTHPRLFDDHSRYAPHTVATNAPSAAGLLHQLLREMDWRLANVSVQGTECEDSNLIIVFERLDEILAPAQTEPCEDGSAGELERQSALFIQRGLRRLIASGPRAGMSVLATCEQAPGEAWPNTSTIHLNADRPELVLDGIRVPFTLT
jgi:hypothetical protein